MAAPALLLQLGVPAAPFLLPLALLLACLLLLACMHRRSALGAARPPRGVPTPRASAPLLGNALEVVANRHRLHDWLLDRTLELGGAGSGASPSSPAQEGQGAQRSLEPRTWAFTTPLNPLYLVVSSPAALEHVLSAKGMDTYVKGPQFRARLGDLLGGGIFCADGDSWRWQRKLAAHLFSAARFREFVASAFALSVEHLFDALEPHAEAAEQAARAAAAAGGGSCTPPPSVDLHSLMYDLTLDTFARVGFGVELGMLEAAAGEARRAAAEAAGSGAASSSQAPPPPLPPAAVNGVTGREFARAFDEAQRLVNRRFWLPLWRLCEAVTGDADRVRRDVRSVRAFAEGIVRQRRALLEKEAGLAMGGGGGSAAAEDAAPDARPDLLTLFMRPGALASSARFDGKGGGGSGAGVPHVHANGEGGGGAAAAAGAAAATGAEAAELTDAEVVDAVLNFIIASRDTTAQATSWAFYELMRHPDVEAKLLAEADAVLGALPPPSAAAPRQPHQHPTYDQLRQLRYARAVFLEVCRLHPSIPQDCKYAARDDVLPDGTPVPKGCLMLYAPYVVCRLPSFWGEDAAEFRPERWLKEAAGGGGSGGGDSGAGGGFLAPSPYAFPAFNAGPRLCLGRAFAELEGAFALVETLRRYRLRPAGGREEATYEQSTSLPILGGLHVHATRR